jgi:hypothetical protein
MSLIQLAPQIAIVGLPTTALVGGRLMQVYLDLGKDKLDNYRKTQSLSRRLMLLQP